MADMNTCPFCDSHNIASECTDNGHHGVCIDCGATGPLKTLHVVACDAWDTRPRDVQEFDSFAHLRLDKRPFKFAGEA